jgi:hypothetical protein
VATAAVLRLEYLLAGDRAAVSVPSAFRSGLGEKAFSEAT